jgi:hypothetical protein
MKTVFIAVFLCVFASLRETKSVFPLRRRDAEKGKIKSDPKTM